VPEMIWVRDGGETEIGGRRFGVINFAVVNGESCPEQWEVYCILEHKNEIIVKLIQSNLAATDGT
jgi:hypothetical protein